MRKKTTATNTGGGCRVKRRTSQEVGVMPKETIAINHQPTDEDGKTPPEWRLTVGWQADAYDVQLGADNGDHVAGQFFHLDRGQLNRLIRTLRKARDAAFGSDA